MRRSQFWISLFACLIVVVACNLDRGDSDTGTTAPDTTTDEASQSIPGAVATARAALQQAGGAAGTAVQQAGTVVRQAGTAVQQAGTAVSQAGDLAGTAAVVATEQGGAALATVRAINTPDFSALTEKLAAARPDENGNVSITLNESEVNQLLQLRYLVMSAEPELRDATVRFEAGEIVLSGNVPLLLPVGVTLSMRPVVTDGQFELEILDASLGRLQAPEVVLGFASNLFSDVLGDVIRRLPEGFQLQSITVDEGLLTISGRVES